MEHSVNTAKKIADEEDFQENGGRLLGSLPRGKRLTNQQMDFLRQVRLHPDGLPLLKWPRATTLRKWMRRPRFAKAILALEEASHTESRLVMAGASAKAA